MNNILTKEELNALLLEFNSFELGDTVELPQEIINVLKSHNIHSVIMDNGEVFGIED
ncbi:hypothetical protein [Moritella marina]|uniref:hypothetical protein n=1 Tax=Moritella marina TaxID=90736 RepID=UPI0003024675|nr:hypothetical protein [Moritella marina]